MIIQYRHINNVNLDNNFALVCRTDYYLDGKLFDYDRFYWRCDENGFWYKKSYKSMRSVLDAFKTYKKKYKEPILLPKWWYRFRGEKREIKIKIVPKIVHIYYEKLDS